MIQKLIFDTDMDTDCDDVGALALILENVKLGKTDLLGIIVDTPVREAAPTCESITSWYGVDLPIGTIYASEFPEYETDRYVRYRNHRLTLPDELYFNRVVADFEGKTDRDYEHASIAYRRMLAGADDNSVTILCVGFMTAIEALFQTGPDEISPLSGLDLFKQKVVRVVSMGCADYPETDNYNFNYNMDRVGAYEFFQKCPKPIYVSPDGEDVITGHTFTTILKPENPVRFAYERYNGGFDRGRSSWDLIAAVFAMDPVSELFDIESHGQVYYDITNNHVSWIDSKLRTDYQVKVNLTSEEMAEYLESQFTKENI